MAKGDDRIASGLLEQLYRGLSSLSRGIEDALQFVQRLPLQAERPELAAAIDDAAAQAAELGIDELATLLRAQAGSMRELPGLLEVPELTASLEHALGYVAKLQDMIREHGYAPDPTAG